MSASNCWLSIHGANDVIVRGYLLKHTSLNLKISSLHNLVKYFGSLAHSYVLLFGKQKSEHS